MQRQILQMAFRTLLLVCVPIGHRTQTWHPQALPHLHPPPTYVLSSNSTQLCASAVFPGSPFCPISHLHSLTTHTPTPIATCKCIWKIPAFCRHLLSCLLLACIYGNLPSPGPAPVPASAPRSSSRAARRARRLPWTTGTTRSRAQGTGRTVTSASGIGQRGSHSAPFTSLPSGPRARSGLKPGATPVSFSL